MLVSGKRKSIFQRDCYFRERIAAPCSLLKNALILENDDADQHASTRPLGHDGAFFYQRRALCLLVAAGPISIITHIGVWVARAGGRTACTAGGLFVCACLALLVWIPWFALLLPLLVLFGISTGVMDVAVNAEAASVEIALRRPIMSMMHGVFSIGGATGAALGGLALSAGMTPLRHLLLVSAIGAIVALIARPALLPPADTRAAAQPRGSWRGLWLLGSLACVAFIAEGALYDWTTVYMRDSLHTQYGVAGAAYAVFSAGMALGRFFGDPIRARLGNQKCVQLSGVLACIGMSIALVWQTPWAALAGFMLTGLGLANLVPVMFAAAARVQGAHAAESIARVAGMGYVGFLLGPVLIGVIAHIATLPVGLSLVAICAALIPGFVPRALRGQASGNE